MAENPFLLVLYGVLIQIAMQLMLSKDKTDEQNKNFNFKAFFQKNWDNFLFYLILVPAGALFHEDIIELYNTLTGSQIKSTNLTYIFSGLFISIIVQLLHKQLRKNS